MKEEDAMIVKIKVTASQFSKLNEFLQGKINTCNSLRTGNSNDSDLIVTILSCKTINGLYELNGLPILQVDLKIKEFVSEGAQMISVPVGVMTKLFEAIDRFPNCRDIYQKEPGKYPYVLGEG